jgi:uncharacterized protein YdbL (DUF1318 family)
MKNGKSKLIQAVHAVRDAVHAAVKEQLADERRTYQQIADTVGCSIATVQRIAQMEKISRPVGPKPKTEAEHGDA